jgi:hypothetical protein
MLGENEREREALEEDMAPWYGKRGDREPEKLLGHTIKFDWWWFSVRKLIHHWWSQWAWDLAWVPHPAHHKGMSHIIHPRRWVDKQNDRRDQLLDYVFILVL